MADNRATTQTINVVFTDLVGSTEMSNRLGPEKTEELRVTHFTLLRGAMENHGGTEVKNLGDGLMVVFPSQGAALAGSVAMQQAIDRHNRSGKEPLGVRVGAAIGDATPEDGDYFGEPVVEAARLCAKCDAGQIIVSDLYAQLGKNLNHSFTSIGALELRGVPDPVLSVTVDWDPVEIQGALPIPERLQPDILQLAGRHDHMESLTQALKDAEAGNRRVTFLAGEPGVGKTRLSSEIANEAHGHGALTVYGRCDEELSLPYQPWVEAVSYVIDHGPRELVDEVLRLHGPELSLLVPQIRRKYPDIEAPSSTDAETERYHLLQAVTSFLSLVAAEAPVLLVLDDLHWADKPTLTLLRHVFTNGDSTSLMIVGTYRDSDLEAGHPLIDTVAALRREPGVDHLNVRGLDDAEMVQLVTNSAEHELDDDMVAMAHNLRQETAGNAFFAHEILRNLVEVGDLYLGDDGRWVVTKTFEELTLPQSVRDVVGQRVARMGEESLKSLRAAAVIGKEFDLALVAEITDADEDDLLDAFEAAVEAGILAEVPGGDERFRFLHTLTRNTLQGELSDGRRRRMHRKIAEALEASIGDDPGDRVGELATHWLAASVSVDIGKAIEYARLAGQRAAASLAPDEAIRWFTTALDNLEDLGQPDEAMRAALLLDLGTAQRNGGDPDYRQTLLDAGDLAATLGDVDLMASAAIANNRGMYSRLGEKDDERIAAIERATEAVGRDRTSRRAMLLATLFSELEYAAAYDERLAIIDEAIEIAREIGDDAVLCAALNRSCVTSAAPHNLDRRRSVSQESLAIAQRLGDATLEFWARCGVFQAAIGSGDLETAGHAVEALSTAADASARPTFRWVAGNLRGVHLAAVGDADQMELVAGANFGVGADNGEPDAFDYYAIVLMTARWLQGRVPEILEQLLSAAEENVEIPSYRAVGAMFKAELGDLDGARELLQVFKDDDFDYRVNNVWSTVLAPCGVASMILEDREAAASIYEKLSPFAGQMICNQAFTFAGVDGILGGLAGLLGDHDAAARHFAEADAMTSTNGAQWTAARDALTQARYHAANGNTERAQDHVSRCLVTARELGYADLEHKARAVLTGLAG
ncbi:MAG: AAA family ATPase [Actinomycetota bacterium]